MEPPGETRVSIPPDLLSKIVGETLNVAEQFASLKLCQIAQRAGLQQKDITPQLAQAAIGERRKQIVADLTPLALQEWGLDPQISPTAAILLILGPWMFSATSAWLSLASLAAERLALEKARAKAAENPDGKVEGQPVEKAKG